MQTDISCVDDRRGQRQSRVNAGIWLGTSGAERPFRTDVAAQTCMKGSFTLHVHSRGNKQTEPLQSQNLARIELVGRQGRFGAKIRDNRQHPVDSSNRIRSRIPFASSSSCGRLPIRKISLESSPRLGFRDAYNHVRLGSFLVATADCGPFRLLGKH
jgi:hypothetical protein